VLLQRRQRDLGPGGLSRGLAELPLP